LVVVAEVQAALVLMVDQEQLMVVLENKFQRHLEIHYQHQDQMEVA
jgi:hypothetical protein